MFSNSVKTCLSTSYSYLHIIKSYLHVRSPKLFIPRYAFPHVEGKQFLIKSISSLPLVVSNNCCRNFSISRVCNLHTTAQKLKKSKVSVVLVKPGGDRITVQGKEGDNLLDMVVDNNIELDGFGACEGTLSCSTCHLIFKKEDYERIPEKPTDEELDMLDLAYGLTETSRLGCQVCVVKELEGMEVTVPAGVSDARDSSQASSE